VRGVRGQLSVPLIHSESSGASGDLLAVKQKRWEWMHMAIFTLVLRKQDGEPIKQLWAGKADAVKAHARRLVGAREVDIVEVVDESGTPIASYDDQPLPDAAAPARTPREVS
jgi:hypothetical protein